MILGESSDMEESNGERQAQSSNVALNSLGNVKT